VAAVARQQPWPLPPQLTELRLRPALLRLAEAAMNALAAVWSKDVECKRLAQQVGRGVWRRRNMETCGILMNFWGLGIDGD
jgi:hypothetical protein